MYVFNEADISDINQRENLSGFQMFKHRQKNCLSIDGHDFFKIFKKLRCEGCVQFVIHCHVRPYVSSLVIRIVSY